MKAVITRHDGELALAVLAALWAALVFAGSAALGFLIYAML